MLGNGLNKASCLVACAIVFTMTGCVIEDEGAVDYRRAAMAPAQGALKESPVELIGKYGPEYDDKAARITQGEYYQITLKQGLVRHMDALPALSQFRLTPDGEVAIVANVFEVSKTASEISFGPTAYQQAKVIYYSSDVFKGQYLNLSQLPIYGPVKYEEGNMVVVQLIGLEIDQVDDRTSNLLKQLANLGSGVAAGYNPMTGPAASVLTDLALAFLNGSNNDVIFFYTFTLAQEKPSAFVPQDYLTEGERVLIRTDDRRIDFDWDSVRLDRDTGRLLNTADDKEYRDNTYMVVDVTRTRDELTAAQHQTLDELLKDIRTDEGQSPEELDRIAETAKALTRSNYTRRLLEPRLKIIAYQRADAGERRAAAFNLLSEIKADLSRPEDQHRLDSNVVAEALARLRQLALAGDADFDQSLLTEKAISATEDINALARQVSDAINKPE